MRCFALGLLLLFSQGACDEQNGTTAQANTPQHREHHFDPITRAEGNLAVDTTTGQMCKTWDWVCPDGDTYYNAYTKKLVDKSSYGVSCPAIRMMPTCESLSRQ